MVDKYLTSTKAREPLAAWLLPLWDTRVDSIIHVVYEIEWMASITTQPSLRQRLQNPRCLMKGALNQRHTLMEWINTAICTMWSNVGELLDTVNIWHTYAKLTQVVRDLGRKQLIFKSNT